MNKKEVIFILLDQFADWEGAYISTCLNIRCEARKPYQICSKNNVSIERVGYVYWWI